MYFILAVVTSRGETQFVERVSVYYSPLSAVWLLVWSFSTKHYIAQRSCQGVHNKLQILYL